MQNSRRINVLLLCSLLACGGSIWAEDTTVASVRAQLAHVKSTDELRQALSAAQELRARTLLPDVKHALEQFDFATLPTSARGDAYAALSACGEDALPVLIRLAQMEREFALLRQLGRGLYALGPEKSAAAITAAIKRGDLSDTRVEHLVLLWGGLGKPGVTALISYLNGSATTREILEYCAIATAQLRTDKVDGAEELARALELHTGALIRTAQRDLFNVAAVTPATPAAAKAADEMEIRTRATESSASADSSGTSETAAVRIPPAVDLVLLVDASASMTKEWEKTQQLVVNAMQALAGKTSSLRVGWIHVGNITPNVLVHPLSYAAGNYIQLFAAQPAGSSGNTVNSLNAVLEQCIFRPHARRIVLLIGDDGTVANKDAATTAAKRIRDELSGRVFAIVKSGMQHADVAVDLMCKAGGGELAHAIGKEDKKTRFDFTPDWDAWLKAEP